MKKTFKCIVSTLMALSFIFAISIQLIATSEKYGTNSLGLGMNDIINQTSLTVINDKGIEVVVDIDSNAIGKLTLSEILDTANEVIEPGQKVTIHNVVYPENNMEEILQGNMGSPAEILWPWDPEPTFTDLHIYPEYGTTRVAEDHFIISVARGQTITFNVGFDISYSLSIITEFDAELGIDIAALTASIGSQVTNQITLHISTSIEFTGPTDDSINNSREYRVKFYHRARNFKITVNGETKYGRFWEPMYYAQYSIDSYVT